MSAELCSDGSFRRRFTINSLLFKPEGCLNSWTSLQSMLFSQSVGSYSVVLPSLYITLWGLRLKCCGSMSGSSWVLAPKYLRVRVIPQREITSLSQTHINDYAASEWWGKREIFILVLNETILQPPTSPWHLNHHCFPPSLDQVISGVS